MRSFRIEVRGHQYRGLWRQDGPDGIEVRSDYGTVWAQLEGRPPAEVARELLAALAPAPLHDRGRVRHG